jgi:hypothetical protein
MVSNITKQIMQMTALQSARGVNHFKKSRSGVPLAAPTATMPASLLVLTEQFSTTSSGSLEVTTIVDGDLVYFL